MSPRKHISFGKYLSLFNKNLQGHSKQQYAILLFGMKNVSHNFPLLVMISIVNSVHVYDWPAEWTTIASN